MLPSRMNLQHKLTLAHVIVTLAAILIAEGLALGTMALIKQQSLFAQPDWGLNAVLLTLSAALAGLLLGAWASRSVTRRLQRTIEISRAWLRGNLALRIADPDADDLGLLAEQLDLLAEHLEQDEQDLDELRERNTRLTDQVRALAVVEERNRLARELHDSVKQHLFSLAMTASAIRTHFDALPDISDELAEMVRTVETNARTAQREMTHLIEDLRSGSLEEQGLAAALNDYTLLLGAREHLLVYLDVQGDDTLLPPSVAKALYRVAQEALHNVVRHARATRVDVQLRCIPEQVALTLHDNGIGFDNSQARRGLGLANMQERMMAIDGQVAVESQPGTGTTVVAKAGLTHPAGTWLEIARLDKHRPHPTIENWTWLGQKLVIPVGQTWPWLPADRLHLRRPLVEPDETPLRVKPVTGLVGLKRDYVLQLGQRRTPLVKVHHTKSGYEWKSEGASWALCYIRHLSGNMVLTRNGQSLAAMQYRGRLVNTWSEIIYDGRGYRLSYDKDLPDNRVLVDQAGDAVLSIEGGACPRLVLRRALPVPLLVMATMRFIDEMVSTTAAVETID